MKVSKSHSFYFASRSKRRYYTTDDDYQFFLCHGDAFLERRPSGVDDDAFNSRPLPPDDHEHTDNMTELLGEEQDAQQRNEDELFDDTVVGTHLVERKVPCKVEPKVIFAAERTFFTWVRSALFLFGASITVLKYSYGDPITLIYGSCLLTLSIVFIIYPLIRCKLKDICFQQEGYLLT